MHLFNDEKGNALVITALSLAALMGIASLVTDAGLLYLNRVQLVDSVDAAALAGVQELPAEPDRAIAVGRQFALDNGLKEEEISLEVTAAADTLTVEAVRQVNLFLARVLGFETGTVQAKAAAQVRAATKVRGVAPLGIENQQLEYGKLYTLKTAAPPETNGGEFGALTLGSPGASTYEHNLKYGYDHYLKIGDVVETETGNMSGPTFRAVNYLLSQDNRVPASSFDDFDRDCPRVIIVPVYEPVDLSKPQMKEVRIVGFAAFFLEEVLGNGNESFIKGYFVQMVSEGDSASGQANYGLYTVKLIQ